jgi:hypothetical protein
LFSEITDDSAHGGFRLALLPLAFKSYRKI